ncbi:hypothetical protein PR048_032282 [Dryococelus australis]|uniref:Uncharacterized protein n=1 Tax=Dryococelus australis TaxID=614101 RepID=A0ABQ9G1S2_9NEOP|nr:hypothetical protein PR048_032282 [Dryococelus australis]
MTNGTAAEAVHFGWADYSAFGLMVALSTIVGSLIGVCGKQDTKVDYLLGGRSMKVMPIAVSLVFRYCAYEIGWPPTMRCSLVSDHRVGLVQAVIDSVCWKRSGEIPTLFNRPGGERQPAPVLDNHIFHQVNAPASHSTVTSGLACIRDVNTLPRPATSPEPVAHRGHLGPDFSQRQLRQIMRYLEMRFNKQVRFLVSLLFDISIFLYIPIAIYVPALAFNQVSGINLHIATLTVPATCILYTMLSSPPSFQGGLKAVVWTDFLQSFVTVGSSVIVIAIGVMHAGGIGVVFDRSNVGQRLELFNFDPSPLERSTFWTVTVGMTFAWLSSMAASQGMVQKIIALPDIHSARK